MFMTFKIFKDKGQGHTANAFKSADLSRYWSYGTGFGMYTYITRKVFKKKHTCDLLLQNWAIHFHNYYKYKSST